ncbi:hypothetical protein [Rummeliibacillus pycnus]|uniref:hypothetical protein n=1 Tax=Rummeliibacillus pycnus TaxID=101070 RepID=UPI001472FF83|nr:hypothetical protein [Rummeliibacillus pycnus]
MTFEEQQYQVYLSAKQKDRGSIKWSMAMMMPEHVHLLQKDKDVMDTLKNHNKKNGN